MQILLQKIISILQKSEIKKIVDECVAFTENSPEPPLEELYTDVYAD